MGSASDLTDAKPRRLVPDFDQSVPDFDQSVVPPVPTTAAPEVEEVPPPSRARRLWLGLAVLLSAAGAFGWFYAAGHPVPIATASLPAPRPLGLSVDPALPDWHISWNRDASVLRNARAVRLLIQDSGEQSTVDLWQKDLDAATWQFHPRGDVVPFSDVRFRMEATARDGQVSAESFRVITRTTLPAPRPATRPAPGKASPAKSVHRVAPVISAGIRPQIHGKVYIDIRVQVNRQGRVTAAVPAARPRGALAGYLAASAVRAARQWRFEAAGTASNQTLRFSFTGGQPD